MMREGEKEESGKWIAKTTQKRLKAVTEKLVLATNSVTEA
jgi:hypothetical protein